MSSGPCITLASYNMHKAVGLDGRRDPHRILRVLQEIDADIVALQEADKRMGGRGSTVPHELIDSHGLYKPVHLGSVTSGRSTRSASTPTGCSRSIPATSAGTAMQSW